MGTNYLSQSTLTEIISAINCWFVRGEFKRPRISLPPSYLTLSFESQAVCALDGLQLPRIHIRLYQLCLLREAGIMFALFT